MRSKIKTDLGGWSGADLQELGLNLNKYSRGLISALKAEINE